MKLSQCLIKEQITNKTNIANKTNIGNKGYYQITPVHKSKVTCLTKLNSPFIAIGSRDSTIKIWDWTTKKCHKTLTDHKAEIGFLAKLDHPQMLSRSIDDTILLWDIIKGNCLKTIKGINLIVFSICIDNSRIAVFKSQENNYENSCSQSIDIWDFRDEKCKSELFGHKRSLSCIVKINKNKIASGSKNEIKIWDLDKESCINTIKFKGYVYQMIKINDRNIISYAKTLFSIWDIDKGNCIRILKKQPIGIFSMLKLNYCQIAVSLLKD